MNPTDFTYSSNELSKGEFIYGAPAKCRAQVYKVIGNATRLILVMVFFPRCITERNECFSSEIVSTTIHRCYKTDTYMLNIALVIGPTAMFLNLLTAAVFFSTKFLRKTVDIYVACLQYGCQ